MNFLEKLIGGLLKNPGSAAKAAQNSGNGADGRQLLGVSNIQNGGMAPQHAVYQPVQTPTPAFSLPQSIPTLQRYGDAQGNQWLENAQGQRFPVPKTPQAFDAPIANRPQQFLRPGVNGALPVGDATVHNAQAPNLPRISI